MLLKLFFIFVLFVISRGYELKQVIILSRHSIRVPWSSSIESLTPNKWPTWDGMPGDLTPKGRLLERAMGKYLYNWMTKEMLFENFSCPKEQVFVYANNVQRTKESAKSFVEGSFGKCVDIYYLNTTDMDPLFSIKIRNSSTEFKEAVLNEMWKYFNGVDLKSAFRELDNILEVTNSSYCKMYGICELEAEKTDFILQFNEYPDVLGPLSNGWMAVDSFLMAYYDGMALENVAWGKIQTTQQWEKLLSILKTYRELICSTKFLDKDIASTLLKYVKDIFQKGTRKLYLLVGHDLNLSCLMSSLQFKDYNIRDQFENTPIGGKLVFQKWHDIENEKDLLRINYVYQSWNQIRDGVEVNLQNPPLWQLLEMEGCAVDKNGFCPWNDFIRKLNNI